MLHIYLKNQTFEPILYIIIIIIKFKKKMSILDLVKLAYTEREEKEYSMGPTRAWKIHTKRNEEPNFFFFFLGIKWERVKRVEERTNKQNKAV